MNKVLMAVFVSLMVVSIMGMASAETLITGKIYDATNPSHWVYAGGAAVTVTCNDHILTTTSSLDDGAYNVVYNSDAGCVNGATLTVSGSKGSLAGSNTGIIHNDQFSDWDLGVVNVPMVPEFGAIAGSLTILGSMAIFFIVRRK